MSGKDTSLSSNRRRRRRVLLAAGAFVVVAATGWWWLRAPAGTNADLADGPAEEIAAAPAQSSVVQGSDLERAAITRRSSGEDRSASPAPSRVVVPKPTIVDRAVPTADAVKTLLPLAEAGRADAMRELAYRLIDCRDRLNADEVSVRRRTLSQFYVRNGHEPKSDLELDEVADQMNYVSAMVEHCRGLDPALMSTRLDWMERAAQGGDLSALLGYGRNALNDMRNFEDVVTNLDEVGRRRQLARSFLQSALNRGVCSALVMFSSAYSGTRNPYGWLFKSDPYLSLIYAEAAVRGGVVSEVSPETSAGVLDPAKRAAAATQGAALAARHCSTPR